MIMCCDVGGDDGARVSFLPFCWHLIVNSIWSSSDWVVTLGRGHSVVKHCIVGPQCKKVGVSFIKLDQLENLGHDSSSAANLTLNLLPRPAGSLNGPRREVAVGLGLLDHGGEPILSESIDQLAVGVSISKVTVENIVSNVKARWIEAKEKWLLTYPMTPMLARMSDSLRRVSLAICPRTLKMAGTCC